MAEGYLVEHLLTFLIYKSMYRKVLALDWQHGAMVRKSKNGVSKFIKQDKDESERLFS